MESVEELRARKQEYLRVQIIDKDYDAQEFTDFCMDSKGNVDIDDWSFADLTQLVSKFISSKRLKEESFEPFASGSPFDRQAENRQALHEFSSFGGVPATSTPQPPSSLNFEFMQQSKPTNLNSLDLDFLSGAFMGHPPPQKPVPQPIANMQNSINSLSRLEGQQQTVKPKLPVQQAPPIQPVSTIKLPYEVAQKISNTPKTNHDVNTIVSTQQPIITQQPSNIPVVSKTVVPAIAVSTAAVATEAPKISNPPLPSSRRADDLFDKVPCRKVITRSLLINSHAEMQITGHEIVTTNMFVPDHVVYHLTTVPLNVEVKRRFKDFEALRTILRKLFPLSKLPHLQKNSRLSETEPEVIKKQKYFLECFVNDLLLSPEYQNCRAIEQFLTLKDLDHLKKKFKEYDKLQKVKCIEQLTSATGELHLKFTEKHLEYNERVENFVEVGEAHFQKVRQLYDQLVLNIQTCVKTLTDLTEVFTSLEKVTREFNTAAAVNAFPQLERCYKYIAELNTEWANSLKTQLRIVDDLKPRFKFEKENMGTIRELLKIRSSIADSYLKRIQRQRGSPEKYTSGKLDDYKQGIDYPSKHITYVAEQCSVLTYQNAYVNEKCSSETERMFAELAWKLKREFGRFSKLQSNICGEMRDLWLEFSK